MKLLNTNRHLTDLLIWITFLFYSIPSESQTDSSQNFQWQFYSDLYYAYDFAKPADHQRPYFLYNHKRHNEVNANLLLARLNYSSARTRANLGLIAGGYAQYNLRHEPAWAQHIYEANLGFRLSKKNKIWIEAGIMPSHIGFESAISASCWTLTRSLMAEHSPYYESGVKISYTAQNDKLQLSLLWLNGWQKIQRSPGIQTPSFGAEVLYLANEQLTINYSNFAGTDQADSLHAIRTYHNFYLQFNSKGKLGLTAGFDLGTDKDAQGQPGSWFTTVGILKYRFTDRLYTAWRAEYFYDPKQILISTATQNGFRTLGLSWNIDARLTGSLLFRTELKFLQSRDAVFLQGARSNWSLTTGLSADLVR